MKERFVEVETPDGKMEVFICTPEENGPHPVIVFFQDSLAVRKELYDMCRRFGTAGYYVAMPNLYYRSAGINDVYIDPALIDEDGPYKKRLWSLLKSLRNHMVVSDTAPLLEMIANDPDAAPAPYAQVGYCMSGQFVYATAAEYADTFAATVSVYGAGLMSNFPDSPHLTSDKIKGEIYFICAEDDHWVSMEDVERLKTVLQDAGTNHRVEVFEGTTHGFAFPERPVYDRQGAERHYERIFAMFDRTIRQRKPA